jgi:tetratricopeptide (TPR) repeat protein
LPTDFARAGDIPGYPEIDAYDPREVAMLPSYCKHTQLFRDRVPGGNNPEEIRRWSTLMGSTFLAMHHYCWGLMKTNRALFLAKSKQIRSFYLTSSIDEFNYVIKHARDDFILLPEILTKKGENLIRLGHGPAGVLELEHAIQLKADYWPPYVALSDYYEQKGDRSKAREVLKQALSFAPDSKAVQRRLAKLAGVNSAQTSRPRETKRE